MQQLQHHTQSAASPATETVLIVDDDEQVGQTLGRILDGHGYRSTHVRSGPEAMRALRDASWDLILCDVNMPGQSGLSLLRHIASDGIHVPVVMVSGIDSPSIAAEAIGLGAYGYVTKPFSSNQVAIAVTNALRRARLEEENRSYREHLEVMVADRTAELTRAASAVERADVALHAASEETISLLMWAIEGRDIETGRHIERMSRYTASLARWAGFTDERCQLLRLASAMHDVGKLTVPDGILLKPGKLSPAEFEVVKQHCEFGRKIFSRSTQPLGILASTIAWTHHERWDGTGYPRGLAGESIPFEGRITAVADVFDALMSRRVYKPAFSLDRTVQIMRESAGSHLDAALVGLFLDHLDEVKTIHAELADE